MCTIHDCPRFCGNAPSGLPRGGILPKMPTGENQWVGLRQLGKGSGTTMDIVDQATRSRMMAGIKDRNTQPEVRVRQALRAVGLRYRLHLRNLPGRPDIVLLGRRVAIFVHGCFWHHHPGCRFAAMPKSNEAFWRTKLDSNVERDLRSRSQLQGAGWRVLTVWECETKDEAVLAEFARRVSQIPTDKPVRAKRIIAPASGGNASASVRRKGR